jgi:hypothetical protein
MSSAQAAMVGTSDILPDTTRTELLDTLQRKDVQQQLTEMGVDPDNAIKRVDSMTNEEIAKLSSQIETLPAGSGVSNVELLLIIIILILVL